MLPDIDELAAKVNGSRVPTADDLANYDPNGDGGSIDPELPEGRTDAANARRFKDARGSRVRHCWPWAKWLVWDDRRWKPDDEGTVEAWAKEIVRDLWTDVKEAIGRVDEKTMMTLMTFAKSSNGANGIRNLLSLARSEPGIPVLPDQLDSDPWALNCINGTLDLRTSKLRPHRQSDLLTKLCPTEYDPTATCPTWRRVLGEIMPSPEMPGYLQRLLGYSLTGLTVEHILPFLYGTGANGKSLFLNALQEVLGLDYSMKAPPDLLMSKSGNSHPTERADLFGKRLVACIESDDGRCMAEALVKELTGGDKVRARRMREDFWEFSPTHTIFLAANHRPVIKGQDHGIWRRVKLIPFTVTIPDDKQDKGLPEKLRAEAPGILAWAVEGCMEWQRAGLREPAEVTNATQSYRADSDAIGQWMGDCCIESAGFSATAKELLESFRGWGGEIGQVEFGQALRARGFIDERITSGTNKGRKGWRGIGLLSENFE